MKCLGIWRCRKPGFLSNIQCVACPLSSSWLVELEEISEVTDSHICGINLFSAEQEKKCVVMRKRSFMV